MARTAAVTASLSAICSLLWLLTDSVSLAWLRTAALAGVIAFAAISVVLSGYAGWIRSTG